MAVITIFRNPFSDECEQIQARAGVALKDAVHFDQVNSRVFVNGLVSSADRIIKTEDVCTIYCYPAKDAGAAVAAAIFVGPITAIWTATGQAGKFFHWIGDGIKSGLMDFMGLGGETSASASSPDTLETIPQLKGAKNQTGLDKTIPLVLGTHLLTPYFCGSPYTFIDPADGSDGENQYFCGLYMLGYSHIKVSDIRLGELKLASNSGAVMNGAIACDSPIFAESGALLEIQQANEVSLYQQKIIEEQISIELGNVVVDGSTIKNAPIRFSATDPMKIEVEVFVNGLVGYNASGAAEDRSVQVKAQWRKLNGGDADWVNFPAFANGNAYSSGVTTITRQKKKQMRFVSTYTFSFAEIMAIPSGIVEIRLSRENAEATDNRTSDAVTWSAIRSYCFDRDLSTSALVPQAPVVEKDRARTCRLGFRIKAGDDVSGTLDKLNMVVSSVARTWNGSVWTTMADAITAKTTSNNPASVALLALQQPHLGSNPYTDSELDLDAFGALYAFCASKGYTANSVITKTIKERLLVEQILTTCRSQLILKDGKYSPLIDDVRSYPVTVLNRQNTMSATNVKEFAVLPDGLRVSFVNENDGYQTNERYVMFDGKSSSDPDAVFQDIELPFVTNPSHVWLLGRYLLACMKLRPEVWTRKVSLEGYAIPVGSLVSVQDDTILVGMNDGAEIKSLIYSSDAITGIVCDGRFDMVNGGSYGVKIVQADGISIPEVRTCAVVTVPGYTKTLTFATPIPLTDPTTPGVGDIVAFGELSKITTDALVVGKTPSDDQTFELTLVPYDPAIYTADEGTIPEFNSKITAPLPVATISDVPEKFASIEDLSAAVSIISVGNSSTIPDSISSVTAVASKEGITIEWPWSGAGLKNTVKRFRVEVSDDGVTWWTLFVTTNRCFYTFNRDTDGYPEASALASWRVRVKAENTYGYSSDAYGPSASGQTIDTSAYSTWIPAVPSVTPYCNGREAVINVSASLQYGKKGYYFQICKKATTPLEADWRKPDITLDARASEANYTDGTSGSLFMPVEQLSQTLPLTNQALGLPADTKYWYRVRGVSAVPTTANPNAELLGDWSAAYGVLARGTDNKDIIEKSIKTAQLDESAVTVEKLNVLARNLVNPFTDTTLAAPLEGWSVSSGTLTQVTDATVGYPVGALSANVMRAYSAQFAVNPTDVLEVTMAVRTPSGSTTVECCVGDITNANLYEISTWDATAKAWGAFSGSVQNKILHNAAATLGTSYLTIRTYLVGSAVDPTNIPAPTNGLSALTFCARAKQGVATISVVNRAGTAIVYAFAPSVRSISGGKLTAAQIVARDLSAITATLGEVKGGTSLADDDRIVLGDGYEGQEITADPGLGSTVYDLGKKGTLKFGKATDTSFFWRVWNKTATAWEVFLKMSRFVVDAISSRIEGVFQVIRSGGGVAFQINPASSNAEASGSLFGKDLRQWINNQLPLVSSIYHSSGNTGKWSKICRITLTSQYSRYFAVVRLMSNDQYPWNCELFLHLSQDTALGNNPVLPGAGNYVLFDKGLLSNSINVGYVIVQNTPTSIVDVYVQINLSYMQVDCFLEAENSRRATWINASPFETPAGIVQLSTRVKTSHEPDGSILPATSLASDLGSSSLFWNRLYAKYLEGLYGNIASSRDEWLRLNDGDTHANGVYAGTRPFRTDGELQVGDTGAAARIKNNSDDATSETAAQATLAGGLGVAKSIAIGDKVLTRPRVDFGNAFETVSSGTTTNTQRVAISGEYVIAVGDNGTILRSTDYGSSFSPITTGTSLLLRGVSMYGQYVIVVGYSGLVLRSTNYGASFTQVSSGTIDNLYAVAMSGQYVIAVGIVGNIFRSTDYGATFTPVSSGTGVALTDVAISGQYVIVVGSNGIVLRSTNYGASFTSITSGTTNNLSGVAISGQYVIVVGYGNTIQRSTDYGVSFSTASGAFGNFNGVSMYGQHVFAAGEGGIIRRSPDYGATFANVSSGTSNWLRGVSMSDKYVFTFGYAGLILRSITNYPLMDSAFVRAWVVFVGTTTVPTILASFNVASVEYLGYGKYRVNFINAMPHANYSPVHGILTDSSWGTILRSGDGGNPGTMFGKTTTSFTVQAVANMVGASTTAKEISIAVIC